MPVKFYNRITAIQHARQFAKSRDPNFADYSGDHGGGDCTNFVSQCLYVGGWTMITGGERFSPQMYGHERPDTWGTPWWARPPSRKNSRSWSSANWFLMFLATTDRASPADLDELIPGDLITHEGDQGRHVMLVSGIQDPKGARIPLLTYHTTDRLDYPFGEVIKGFASEGFKYWKLRDFYEGPD